MILLKPAFVSHDGCPIFCIDLHPQGMKFATGGLSPEGGRIIIWNLFPVVEKIAEEKDNVPRKLHHMNVSDCVYCLRWNNAGDLLASGGGGNSISIWRKDDHPDGLTKLFETETWGNISSLNGHTERVLDLAWAPQDQWLATAGADKSIIIWNVTSGEVVSRLNGHEGQVKGVAWDPVGMYLASQAGDKTCRIWRTSDWQQQIEISEPFRESRSNTHFLRLCWSPDGQYLVTANATNSGEPTARIVEINGRPIKEEGDSWSCEMDFVGHLKEVTCVRFNSALFKKRGVKTKHCVLATGSRDNTVAVWSTVQRGPIVVVRNLFSKSIVDLAWGPNGLLLVACSTDGTVGVMVFKELGQVVSVEDQVTTLESMYGKSYTPQLPNESKIITFPSTTSPVKIAVSDSVSPSIEPTVSIKTELKQEVTSNSLETSNAQPMPSDEIRLHAKQIETRLADGKRRITPIKLPSRSGMGEQTFSSSSDLKTKIIVERREIVQKTKVSSSDEMELSPTKRKEVESNLRPAKKLKRDLIPIELPRSKSIMPQQSQPRVFYPSTPICRPLEVPDVAIEQIMPFTNNFIEIFNSEPQKRYIATRVRRSEANVETIWQIKLDSRVVAVRATEDWTVLVLNNKILNIIQTESGRNVHCPICIPHPPAHLVVTQSQHVCVVNVLGHITVWDLRINHVVLEDKQLRNFLISDNGEIINILSCEIFADGTPFLSLSSGATIVYCRASGWVLLCDASSIIWNTIQTHPLFRNTLLQFKQSMTLGMAVTESKWSTKYSLARINGVDESSAKLCVTGALINLLLSAQKLQSPTEYKMIILDLARFFAENVSLTELEILLKSLAAPVENDFLGLKNNDVLTEILNLLSSFPQCEKLAGTYLSVNEAS